MRELTTYRQNSVSEIDRLRIKELQKQYYRMLFVVCQPIVILAVIAGIMTLLVYQATKPLPFSLIIGIFFFFMLGGTLPAMPIFFCAFDEIDATKSLLQKPGYKEALMVMRKTHPVIARRLLCMLPRP